MSFSSPPEIRTLRELKFVLAPLGYDVSQKVRLLDCVMAAAQNPAATVPVGTMLGDVLVPALRQLAGPFARDHPWLRPGDWPYAFSAHLDFVVHDRLDGENPTHPLFAVEFDGRTTHSSAEATVRDLRKNRLCAASGLPLIRIGEEFLHKREHLSTIAWLVQLWAAHREEMPQLIADRDADVAQMAPAERDNPFLLGEHPELDVNLVFAAQHRFPAVTRLAHRLAAEHGLAWPWVGAHPTHPRETPWTAAWFSLPVPALNSGMIETWTCEVMLHGPRGYAKSFIGRAYVRTGYPLDEGEPDDSWDQIMRARLPWLPAGPWTTAPSLLGAALSTHNALVEVGYAIKRHR
ncbi:DUF2726 domain-containing protein [Actinokineospora sp. UTMC 2448]|uniref:DUF2726 domain-containing protein n=1 Tax=Actinokineospora sp. UTMC 2448 TaxID=2268449 RepID=UPI0021645733|nr:DUF2726 domain-containing protein [Actinokineospora sp. UTMC 2448]